LAIASMVKEDDNNAPPVNAVDFTNDLLENCFLFIITLFKIINFFI
jgi:hypothetical protein